MSALEPFTAVTSVVAWMPESNVDTDIIFPARFLLLTHKEGLGKYAFHDRRFAPDGRQDERFVLNQPRYRGVRILLVGDNFGCGSSREQAPWALQDLGIRCIIAPGFAEIFAANCFQNGILPLALTLQQITMLMPAVEEVAPVTVDLERQRIDCAGRCLLTFVLAPERRLALLNGWDEVAMIVNSDSERIAAFERAHRRAMPWLFDIQAT